MQPGLIGELDIHGEAKYAQDVDGLSRSSLAQVWQHGMKKEMCVVNHELTFYSNSCNSWIDHLHPFTINKSTSTMFSKSNPGILYHIANLVHWFSRFCVYFVPIPSTSKSSTLWQAGDSHGVYKGGGVQEELWQETLSKIHKNPTFAFFTCKMIYHMSNATFTNCSKYLSCALIGWWV